MRVFFTYVFLQKKGKILRPFNVRLVEMSIPITIGALVPNIKVSFLDFKVHNPVVVVY